MNFKFNDSEEIKVPTNPELYEMINNSINEGIDIAEPEFVREGRLENIPEESQEYSEEWFNPEYEEDGNGDDIEGVGYIIREDNNNNNNESFNESSINPNQSEEYNENNENDSQGILTPLNKSMTPSPNKRVSFFSEVYIII